MYHMIRQLVLNYVLAIFILKKGDCSNNVQIQVGVGPSEN